MPSKIKTSNCSLGIGHSILVRRSTLLGVRLTLGVSPIESCMQSLVLIVESLVPNCPSIDSWRSVK